MVAHAFNPAFGRETQVALYGYKASLVFISTFQGYRVGPCLESQMGHKVRARLAVSVLHDVHCGLMPPVQHHHCKDVPDLVA